MESIFINILGGVLSGLVLIALATLFPRYRCWQLKMIYGNDIDKDKDYHIVYAKLSLPTIYDQYQNVIPHPYIKERRDQRVRKLIFSIEHPVSSCELRATKYIASAFSSPYTTTPTISSDFDVNREHDLSFISLGGPGSNWKTEDISENVSNIFGNIEDWISWMNSQHLRNTRYDYVIILRITPGQFPNRVWIACAGLGEWGSSGASYFLANKWQELLHRRAAFQKLFGINKYNDFIAVIRVLRESDESAELMHLFRDAESAEQLTHSSPSTMLPDMGRNTSSESSTTSTINGNLI